MDTTYGLVQHLLTTPANNHDTRQFPSILRHIDLIENSFVLADKGYYSKKNKELLKQFSLRSGIMLKLKKNDLESIKILKRRYNKKISKIRYIVERTFGTLHKDYGYDRSRYFGLAKTDFFLKLGAISFNLKRVLKIVSIQPA